MTITPQSARRSIPWQRKCNPLWTLFGDEDDPEPPDSHATGKPQWWRRITWWCRNPLHNLMFYVIGVADRDRTLSGQHGTDVHPAEGGWLWCITRAKSQISDSYLGLVLLGLGLLPVYLLSWPKLVCIAPSILLLWISSGYPLPFVSYLGKHIKAYIGWRPAGAFGIKFNIIKA